MAPPRGARSARLARWLRVHRRTVLVASILVLLAMTPFAVLAPNYISYSSSNAGPAGSQSTQVQSLLAASHPELSSLFVVFSNTVSPSRLCQLTYNFTEAAEAHQISHYNDTASVCAAGAALVNGTYGPHAALIRSTRAAFANLSSAIYAYPSTFYTAWEAAAFARSSINATFNATRGQPGYEDAVRASLYANYSSSQLPSALLDSAVRANAPKYFPGNQTVAVLLVASVLTYADAATVDLETAGWLTVADQLPTTPDVVAAFAEAGDPGWNLVQRVGYTFLPAAIVAQFVSPDNSTVLAQVVFNVPEGYRGPDNFYPAEVATPEVRDLATQYFGPSAGVTGSGAITYDTTALTAASGFLFGLTFLFLVIAVFLTLQSLWSSVLTMVFVGIGFLLGYFAIFLTALLFGSVNYLVTYTLEAVTLGIVTDYLVFLLYRYREELREGVPHLEAVERATETAGFAILTSALIVAVGLGVLSFIPGLESWGVVLFLAVLFIGIVEALLLPVVTSYLGPRLFLKRALVPRDRPIERSPFYRGAALAIRRRGLVIAIVVIVAVPAIFFLFTAPTSYDISQGLPASLPSVQAQNTIAHAFGSNLLYPTYVLVAAPAGMTFLLADGELNPATSGRLVATANDLLTTSGVSGANGPYVIGNHTGSASASAATAFVFDGGTRAYYLVYLAANPLSLSAMGTIQTLRGNSSWLVGGVTAALLDQKTQNDATYPVVEAALVVLIAIILAFAFRSAVYPLISIAGVFVSISVTVVLLYAISEFLLHQVLIYLIPLVLIVILLSLGNDYTVFILSRVVEERRRHPRDVAIPRGIAHSGVVVTSLGLILAVSLGSLGLQPVSFLEQLGIAFAISLVLDTFLIRIFFFPAAMSRFARD